MNNNNKNVLLIYICPVSSRLIKRPSLRLGYFCKGLGDEGVFPGETRKKSKGSGTEWEKLCWDGHSAELHSLPRSSGSPGPGRHMLVLPQSKEARSFHSSIVHELPVEEQLTSRAIPGWRGGPRQALGCDSHEKHSSISFQQPNPGQLGDVSTIGKLNLVSRAPRLSTAACHRPVCLAVCS